MNVDWLSAVGMLLAGLIVGFMFVYSMRRREGKSNLDLRDLEAKRDTLLAALRDLGNASPEERAKLERQTAEVLKAIDEQTKAKKPRKGAAAGAAPEPAAQPLPVATPRGATIKGFAWGAGSMLVLAGIGYFVMQQATPKEAGQPSAMGGAPQQQQQQQQGQAAPQADPALLSLEQAVQKNPNDLALHTELAKAYLDRENMMGTYEQTQFVLERAPQDPKALTYQAIVRIAMGQVDSALAMLNTATKADPDLLDAWVSLAWANTITGKDAEAKKAIDEAATRHPDQKARLDTLLERMRAEQKVAKSKLPSNHPPVPPPGQSAAGQPQAAAALAPTPAPAAAAGEAVHVTLQLAAGVKPPAAGVIYLMARPEGVASGPPVAVKRVPLGAFPMTIDFGAADSMMGDALPAKMHLEARVDTDGNAMTRDPGAPAGAQDNVANGARVTLTLK